MATHTIWGKADHSQKIAPGIMWYDTPRHGGFHLSKKRMAELPEVYKALGYGTQDGWFEEDCNWAAVVVTWPEYFNRKQFDGAIDTLSRMTAWGYFDNKILPIGQKPSAEVSRW